MTIYAVANEEDSFHFARPNTDWFSMSANVRDPDQPYAPGPQFMNYAQLTIPAVDECWLHFRLDASIGSDASRPLVALRNLSTGKDAFQMTNTDTASTAVFRWNSSGSSYTEFGRIDADNNSKNHLWDIYFKRGASGVIKVFQNNVLVLAATGNYSTVDSTWDAVILNSNDSNSSYFGGFMVGDAPMFNHRLDTMYPNASGATNTWTGAYTDIDEAPYASRADAIFTDTPGAAYTFNYESVASMSASYEIKALMVASMGALDATAAITDIELYMRHSGTNYTYGSLGFVAGNGDYGGQQIFHTDPLGAAWTSSSINDLEIGAIAS